MQSLPLAAVPPEQVHLFARQVRSWVALGACDWMGEAALHVECGVQADPVKVLEAWYALAAHGLQLFVSFVLKNPAAHVAQIFAPSFVQSAPVASAPFAHVHVFAAQASPVLW